MSHEIQPASSNLPQQKKVMPNWGLDYLAALNRAEGGLTIAAELIGKDYSTTFKARRNYPELGKAVDEIKREWDSHNLAELEEISLEQAKKPGNVIERIFRMKAYDPGKYREKAIAGPGNINIVFGFHIGDGKDKVLADAKITDADVEEGEGPKTTGNGKMSILSDDEVEIDV